MRAFWFHYNKPESKRRGHPVMTLHYSNQCSLVRRIICHVPVRTRERRSQPHVVMAGRGWVSVVGNTAYITGPLT